MQSFIYYLNMFWSIACSKTLYFSSGNKKFEIFRQTIFVTWSETVVRDLRRLLNIHDQLRGPFIQKCAELKIFKISTHSSI